jgi:dUTP pyrophosphatase
VEINRIRRGPVVKFLRIHERAELPKYKSELASGFDFVAVEAVCIPSKQTRLIKTGLKVELPAGTELQIRSRSGMALDWGLVVLNSPGTVDADYRGEIMVIVRNVSDATRWIKIGDRFAQGVIAPVVRCEVVEVEEVGATERGEGGFGSTGDSEVA